MTHQISFLALLFNLKTLKLLFQLPSLSGFYIELTSVEVPQLLNFTQTDRYSQWFPQQDMMHTYNMPKSINTHILNASEILNIHHRTDKTVNTCQVGGAMHIVLRFFVFSWGWADVETTVKSSNSESSKGFLILSK